MFRVIEYDCQRNEERCLYDNIETIEAAKEFRDNVRRQNSVQGLDSSRTVFVQDEKGLTWR